MNPIRKLTLQSLRMNRKRSIMTILGIALSCALIVAVVGMLTSAQATIIQHAKETNGDFHALYGGLPEEELHLITDRDDVEHVRVIRHAGYAVAEKSENEYKPYYYLLTMDEETMEASAFRLREGRFPENENEVLVSAHIGYNGGITLREGETLTLAVGTRIGYGDTVMSQHAPYAPEAEEKIKDTTEHSFTIVGIMDRPSYLIEQYDAPGYTIVTCDPEGRFAALSGDKKLDVQVTFTSAAAARTGADEIVQALWDGEVPVDSMVINNDLVRFSGGVNNDLLVELFTIIAVIIAIILVTSVFVIRNSFRISVSEKTRQYGLLATVGATRKQIRRSVLYEGFLMGVIGIPLGLAIGAVAVRVLIFLLEIIIGDSLINNLHFVFSLSWIVFVAAVSLSALTIFLSCLIPAQVASRIPPIEAIRGNRDVNLRRDKLKSSRLIRRIFGIGGVIASNNLKRSRKKYRTTVVSLVVSITVFVGLSFFTEGLRRSVSYVYHDYGYNLFLRADVDRYDEIAAKIGVTDYAYQYGTEGRIRRDLWGSEYANELYDSFREEPDYNGWMMCEENENPVYVVFYNSDYFRRYLEEIGARANADPATVGVLFDKETLTEYNEKGNVLGMRTERYTTAKAGDSMEVSLLFSGEAALEEDVEYRSYVLTGSEREEESIVKQSVTRTIQIVSVDAKRPMGMENTYISDAMLVLSEDALPKGETKVERYEPLLYLNAEDPEETERKIATLASYPEDGIEIEYYANIHDGAEETRRFILIIEIFLYGFITVITLIGVTNIFNTITTNMMLRSREFAMLKSVGMTKGQCNRMIMLESFLYGSKSLLFGLPLGVLLAYILYGVISNVFDDGFFIPWKSVGISVVAVFIIVGLTMWYSLAKINKQNIIETIRAEVV